MIDYYENLIKFLCKITGISELPNLIIAKDKKIHYNKKNFDFCYQNVNAKFYTENNIIYINLDLHELKIPDDLFSIIHEFRHYYQLHQVLNYPNLISEKKYIVKKWEKNFDNYINFGKDGYYEQDIEIDANAFTLYIMEFLFDVPCYIDKKFSSEKISFYNSIYLQKYNYIEMQDILDEMQFEVYDRFDLSFN